MQLHILMPILSLCGVSWSFDGGESGPENVTETAATAASNTTTTLRPWVQVQTWATLMDQDRDLQADPASYGDPEDDVGFPFAGRASVLTGTSSYRREHRQGPRWITRSR